MGYVKVIKTSPYFSRFQVKYRRRREGKTDYRARLRLVKQDKNKYNTPKYRLVVRFTNRDITCQIVRSTIKGDIVEAAAYAHELPDYGLECGLTNYAACYCVGLLVARRILTKFGLDKHYPGQTEPDGEDYNIEPVEEGPRPFFCLLDTGLKRTSTGSKVFGCLKGALDGGLDIPHNEKRLVGYDRSGKKMDAEVLKKYIFGGHVAEYMEEMEEEEPEKYMKHFAKYVEADLSGGDLEDKYAEVHAAIREKPVKEKAARTKPAAAKRWHTPKLTLEQRRENLKQKLAALQDDEE
ncbi:hypothetical protein CHLRE_14g621450v5 [Chlamydomonas reinhardtii]|jgi:large subunit ribosomal protein L5e|uniref:Large ribosomal subunit protein uL18 C-terminal eukaryotes domain-containing protein n=1 Tax=Chlamydomonas reinhardtii TaxID=3055 RepID=A8HP55_CHLRE|nr:ribosomal protein L5 [Chlamydomonas reinhardtii]PNW73166.1 hypothetical protein CHLRE_14g621450v5 [Chlamydomonas reinhardtii]|eukprot:XP_001689859.1 ribosomal protein L5 [Chlamydomonas reinhardtii]